MKKVIIAFDGIHFSEGAFEFARKINEINPILLTGVFLSQTIMSGLWNYTGDSVSPLIMPIPSEEESEIVKKSIQHFEKLCQGNNIDYRVHKDFFDFTIPELEKESCFADILILGSQVFYKNADINSLPNEYLQNALHYVQCPVVLTPEKYNFPEKNILAYDGSENSVFAIKQFAYLFPQLKNNPTLLVYADDNEQKDFPDKILIEELATRHFSDLALVKLDINPKKYFDTWLSEKKSAIIISGSYGRSGVSQLIKKSFIKNTIVSHQLPIFIAHK